MEREFKIVVEKHADGYVAYPLGLHGVAVGEGDTYEKALADVKSAIRYHLETFGAEAMESESPVLEAFIAEAGVSAWVAAPVSTPPSSVSLVLLPQLAPFHRRTRCPVRTECALPL